MSPFKHAQKMMSMGLPLTNLAGAIPEKASSFRDVHYKKAGSSQERSIFAADQLEILKSLKSYKRSSNCPIVCISAPNTDKRPTRIALDIADSCIESGLNVAWEVVTTGFKKDYRIDRSADVIVFSNIVSSSTPHKLEILRDYIMVNDHAMRIIVTAGWHGMDLANSIQLPLNGLIYLGVGRQ